VRSTVAEARAVALASEMERGLAAARVDAAVANRVANGIEPAYSRESSQGSSQLCTEGNCFIAGTPVQTAEGLKSIETIQVGELVAARDELTGATHWQRVERVIVNHDREVIDLAFVNADGAIELITVTPGHWFATVGNGWVEAGALELGAQIQTLDARLVRLLSKSENPISATTYNLTVAKDHSYFVGNAGIWVHNICCGGLVETGSGSINYGNLDELGRPTGVDASITSDMIKTGTKANASILPPGWAGNGTANNQARGHLMGNQLGGSGDVAENLVTLQHNPVNSPLMRGYERLVRQAAESGETIQYSVKPIYKGKNLIPSAITITAVGKNGFNLNVSIKNPIGE